VASAEVHWTWPNVRTNTGVRRTEQFGFNSQIFGAG
jgi:hypothetical protein